MTLRAAINRSLSRVTGFEIRRVRQVTTGLITSHPISAKPSNTQRSFAMKPAAVSVAKKHAAQVRSDPGDRHIRSTFFDRYPAFYQTSETAPYQSRLNLRHDAIFEQNREVSTAPACLTSPVTTAAGVSLPCRPARRTSWVSSLEQSLWRLRVPRWGSMWTIRPATSSSRATSLTFYKRNDLTSTLSSALASCTTPCAMASCCLGYVR